MKIAVTGGHGYLGAHVSKFFNAEPLSRRTGFDVTNFEDCERLQDYDVIIHMAAIIDKSGQRYDEMREANVRGTWNVASSVGKNQVLLFSSTKEVHDLKNAYSISKASGEWCVCYHTERTKFRFGIFRLSTTYALPTNGRTWVNNLVESVRDGEDVVLYGQGKQVRDFLHVEDLARAFDAFINSDASGIYDIGGGLGRSATIRQFVELAGKIFNKKPKLVFSDKPVEGQMQYITNLNSILEKLDWQPKISLEEGIRRIA